MTTTTTVPGGLQPAFWADLRLGQTCNLAGQHPQVFGGNPSTWQAAGEQFIAAHNAAQLQGGGPEIAADHRNAGLRILEEAGLDINKLALAPTVAQANGLRPTGQPHHEDPTAQATRLVAEYTMRLWWLRDQAETGAPLTAERATAQYGAACAYERAVRAFVRGQQAVGYSWVQAAEQMLTGHLVPAPWHNPPTPRTAPSPN
jgi:hypothetical protein